jgi:2-polyprenyl-3-methyl-5-hydroxy-6-metoxy-1,4-benzoquinol methylase
MRATMAPEMSALKTRLKATWESGDYGHFATFLLPGALEFLDRLALWPGIRMLDVACGAGQIALPAARAGALVTGVDLADNLVKQARERAQAEKALTPGSIMILQPKTNHFAWNKEEVIVQLNGTGPWASPT